MVILRFNPRQGYNKTISWQKVSISVKPPNCTEKDFFIIKESHPVRNKTKRIKKNLDTECKKFNWKSIVMNPNYLIDYHKKF